MFFFIYPTFIIIEKQTLLIIVLLLVFASGGFSNSSTVVSNLARHYDVGKSRMVILLERNIKVLIIIILIVTSLSYLIYSRFQHFDPEYAKPEEHKRAGYFLGEDLSPDYEELNIMGRKPYVSFYSDSRFTMLPYADIGDMLDFAKLYNVDYIIVDERSLSRWEFYDEYVDLHKYSTEVELVYEDKSGKLIRLFRVK
jgi:hypothetical protein